MALYLTEADVGSVLTMPDVVTAVRDAVHHAAAGQTICQPRRRLRMPRGTYHQMAAVDLQTGMFCQKCYTAFRDGVRFLVLLYSSETGELLSLMEADLLGRLRTGAATGIATAAMAPQSDSLRLAIFGCGAQASTQLAAVCCTCRVDSVVCIGRSAERAADFALRMERQLDLPVRVGLNAEEAVSAADVLITATSARDPVLFGAWLKPGQHINAVGSNILSRRELDLEAVRRCDNVTVDSVEQAKLEAGDLLEPAERGILRWDTVSELADVVSGKQTGRLNQTDITLFKSCGVALEDTAAATLAFKMARQRGLGTEIAPP
ncbi:MAG: ornithine cyclodeaminase family protein [Armatimonadetes bacterium]|nr:ornithine cyclodeaminase family protein [Armatimonadota bacterium]MDE2205964.1 ornithine cyclodeaminase family protein [Armatimonadota bacterium]